MKIFSLLLLFSLCGCASIVDKANRLKPGMSEKEVVAIMGLPNYARAGGRTFYYRGEQRGEIAVEFDFGTPKKYERWHVASSGGGLPIGGGSVGASSVEREKLDALNRQNALLSEIAFGVNKN